MLGRHARLIEKNPAEMLAVGKHLRLKRQKRAARVDEIDARQLIVERHLLRAQMLFHRQWIVRAALHRRVVRDDHHVAARHARDAGDDAGARRVVFVHAKRRQRRQLQKRRAGIDEAIDALAHRHLPLLAMPLKILGAAAFLCGGDARTELSNELPHAVAVGLEGGAVLVDLRFELQHKSVGNRQSSVGSRQSAIFSRQSTVD